jgi:hypothetical protein
MSFAGTGEACQTIRTSVSISSWTKSHWLLTISPVGTIVGDIGLTSARSSPKLLNALDRRKIYQSDSNLPLHVRLQVEDGHFTECI